MRWCCQVIHVEFKGANGSPRMVSSMVGTAATGYDFGELVPVTPGIGAIRGTVFVDADRSATFDLGENGVSGVTLTLPARDPNDLGCNSSPSTSDAATSCSSSVMSSTRPSPR